MAVVVYVPSRIGGGDFTDLPVPLVGDNGKAVTYDHGTGAFVYTPFETAGAVATHVGLADPHTQYELETNNTASAILTKILTVDGAGSGLDADLLDGNSSAAFLLATGATTGATSQAQTFTNGIIAGVVRPLADSATAITFEDTAGNSIAVVDTPNAGLRIGRLTSAANGCLSIGSQTASPNYAIRIDRTQSTPTLATVGAINGEFQINNVGTATILFGLSYAPRANHATGTLADLAGIRINTRLTAAGTVTRGSAVYIRSNDNTGGGTLTTNNGIYIEDQTAGSTNYAIYTNAGLVRFGGQVQMVASGTAAASVNIPHGSAPTSPVNGDMWTTTAGLFVRINGSTVGPLS